MNFSNRITRPLLLTAAAAALLVPASASAAAGDLDPGFGQGGLIRSDDGGTSYGNAVAVDAAGRTITVGSTRPIYTVGSDIQVMRFLPDGTSDPAFGTAGTVNIPISKYSDYYDIATRVIALKDGDILIGGRSGTSEPEEEFNELLFIRLNSDGSLDPGFGDGGIRKAELPDFDGTSVDGMGVTEKGDIVATANNYTSDYTQAVATRLTSSGDVTNAYGSKGFVSLPPGVEANAGVVGDEGGATIVGIGKGGKSKKPPAVVFRLDPDGNLNKRFGMTRLPFGSTGQVTAVAIDGKGRIVAAGSSSGGPKASIEVARLLPNGKLDRSFGHRGHLSASFGGARNRGVESILIDSKGRVVLVGTAQITEDFGSLAAMRLTKDGAIDKGFGRQGVATATFQDASTNATEAALGRDDSITAVGITVRGATDVVLARWQG